MATETQALADSRTADNIKHFSKFSTKSLRETLALMPAADVDDQREIDIKENIPAITAVILGRGEPIEEPLHDYIVTTNAVITYRVENMREVDAKPMFDEEATRVGLYRRLRDAVENTDFYIELDTSDTFVEEARD